MQNYQSVINKMLTIGSNVDERAYFRTILDDMQQKCTQTSYGERRAFEMDAGDFDLGEEIELAMQEIS